MTEKFVSWCSDADGGWVHVLSQVPEHPKRYHFLIPCDERVWAHQWPVITQTTHRRYQGGKRLIQSRVPQETHNRQQ